MPRHEVKMLYLYQYDMKSEATVKVYGKMLRPPPGGLEPPTFRLTAERANLLRHGGHGVGRRQRAPLSPPTAVPLNITDNFLRSSTSDSIYCCGILPTSN